MTRYTRGGKIGQVLQKSIIIVMWKMLTSKSISLHLTYLKRQALEGVALCLLLLHVEDNRNYYGPDVTKYLKFCCTEHMNFIDCKLLQANTFKAIPILETSVIANQTAIF